MKSLRTRAMTMARALFAAPRALKAAGLCAGLLGGCGGEDVTYSYFAVDVKIDASYSFLERVSTCVARAEGPQTHEEDLRCSKGTVPHNLGTFDYVTSATSGSVTFTVTLKDIGGRDIGQGKTGPVSIVAGGTQMASVTVVPLPEPDMMP